MNVKKSNIKTNIFCSHNRIRRMGGLKGVKGWERAGGTRGRGMKKRGRNEGDREGRGMGESGRDKT